MINLHEKLVEEKMKSKIILQIHDELIIESPDNEVEKAAIIIKEIMEKAFTLDVPLKVDLEIGESWN
jgi:DNA polymerase-1